MNLTREEFFKAVGERPGILKIVKIFYDKVYADPWLSLFFAKIPQEHIENQQADFMAGALGGPQVYNGRPPLFAHEHINISEEVFEARSSLLREALEEAGVAQEIVDAWMKLDSAFKKGLVKTGGLSDCKKRFFTDEILSFPDPRKKAS